MQPTRYNVTLSNGDTFVWIGHRSELVPWDGRPPVLLLCEGGTLVNLQHVVCLRPVDSRR